jgi:conjugal transfer pilus assembly protein TraU
LLGAKLINGICWDCAFPWRLMGNMTFGGNAPKGATKKAVCTCNDSNGVPKPGTTAGFWNPARIIEVVRNPWCSPTVGGKKLMEAYRLVGNSRHSKLDDSFMNVHLLAFPVMQMLELLLDTQCNPESYVDLDFISMSEVDPIAQRLRTRLSSRIHLVRPSRSLRRLPGGAAACVAETAGQETDEIFLVERLYRSPVPYDRARNKQWFNGQGDHVAWYEVPGKGSSARSHSADDGG